jgi:hypothetical protein
MLAIMLIWANIESRPAVTATGYLWQVPSYVWQYSPAWQKCQWCELLAWHSQVLAVTSPVITVRKALELDGGERVGRQQNGTRAHQSDQSRLHC